MSAPHPSTRLPFPLPESALRRPEHGFLLVAAPILGQAWARLSAGVAACADPMLGDPAETAALLFEELVHGALNLVTKTLVLELHVAKLAGTLVGETPEARFLGFVEQYRDPDVLRALFEEYPVLEQVLSTTVSNAVDARLELVGRLVADRPLGTAGEVLAAVKEAGDPHRGGRTVLIVTFRSGARLVYKPKSLAVDRHLHELLSWVGERGFEPAFRTVGIVDRGDYGWQEFLTNDPCDDAEAVGRFYRRTGGLLAVLYALAGTDVHFENLVAVGEHPVPIDAETLFHPGLLGNGADPGTALVNLDIATSVLGVGLLPERTAVGGGASVDLSGIGASGDQPSPQEVTFWQDAGQDTMRLGRRRMPMPLGEHAPSLDGRPAGFGDHAAQIVDGFAAMVQVLSDHRDELLAGPIAAFAEDPIRTILRPTQRYATLYRDSSHPDLLRRAADRDQHFDRLWRDVALRPELRPVVPCEREALQRGDIPVFSTTPSSRELVAGTGDRFPDFLPESGLDVVRRRIAGLDEAGLARQLWYVRASLSAGSPRSARPMGSVSRPIVAEGPLGAALAIAARLRGLACRGDGFASWVGESTATDGSTSIRPIGCELYAGTAGIALFLGALRTVAGDVHRELLDETVATLRVQVERRVGADGIGAFTGWSGAVYALSHLAGHLGDPSLLALATSVAESLGEAIDADDQADVIGGAAGCCLSLLASYAQSGSPAVLGLARRCGDRLLQTARPAGPGLGWVVPGASAEPLAGMAHGAAGIALALDRLATVTGEAAYAEAARAAIRYERTLCDGAGRWADLRAAAHGEDAPGAWCHGGPGIGLARLAGSLDEATVAEIGVAVERTLADGFAFNESLCHGALGNAELVGVAGHVLDRPEWSAAAGSAVDRIVARWASRGPTTGVLGGLEAPGLMTGLAGIGYGLLRSVDRARVPSVLVLAPYGGGR